MSWFNNQRCIASYRLFPTTYVRNKAGLMSNPADLNIEVILAWLRVNTLYMPAGRAEDYPLPDADLTTRPKQSEIVQYADYSQRPQGVYSFQWGFKSMKPWVFGTWMWYLGFERWRPDLYHFYDYDAPVWSVPVYVMTLDSKSEKDIDRYWASAAEVDNYRFFSGTMKRPIPNVDYKIGVGGAYDNVIFRFVGCTEIVA